MFGIENDEEEQKRKNLIKVIVIVGVVVGSLLLFLLVRALGGGGKKEEKKLSCTLEIKGNVQPGSDGVYTEEIEIGFKDIQMASEKAQLVKKTVGTSDTSRNTETFKLIKSGSYTVNGYLQDSDGNEGTCSIRIEVKMSNPSCELEVKSGTLGQDGWYTSNVEVAFASKETNSNNSTIAKYYIGVNVSEDPGVSFDTYTLTEDGVKEITGYVVGTDGKTGICSISIKKDSTPPTCTLKVLNGASSGSNTFTSSPTIGIDNVSDNLTEVKEQGVGVSKNYSQTSYTLNDKGSFTINGYVKDGAGNEGTCSMGIKYVDPEPSKPTQPTQPTQPKEAFPSCVLKVTAKEQLSETQYVLYNGTGNVYIDSMSSNTVKYGIGTSSEPIFNGKTEYQITGPGSYQVTAWVANKSGDIAFCQTPVIQFIKK